MSKVIVRKVPGAEVELGIGVMASTPPHFVVAWGEYAADGEADGEVRVMAAVDEDGVDITEKTARVIAGAISDAIDSGKLA